MVHAGDSDFFYSFDGNYLNNYNLIKQVENVDYYFTYSAFFKHIMKKSYIFFNFINNEKSTSQFKIVPLSFSCSGV